MECEVRIEIPMKGKNMDDLFKAEGVLRKLGISFDTGFAIQEERRDWEFDYSLKGAKVIFKKMKNGETKTCDQP